MKTLLSLAAATAATLFACAPQPAQAGPSQAAHCKVHSTCGHCRQPVYTYYRPVRYVNHNPIYGWIPSHHSLCGARTPVQVYNYGYGAPVTNYYTYPSVRSYNVYRSYPTSRGRYGFLHCR